MPRSANDAQDKVRVFQRKLYRAAKQQPGRRFHALYDKIHRRDVLERAWKEVAAHGGAAGVDGVTIDMIREQGVEELLSVLEGELREGTYRPLAVRRVAIPKASGGERMLGIPAVRDRVVQAATKLVIEPVFEADFLECSWGFRPRRSAREARERIRTHIQREQRHVIVDADIKGLFDNLDRRILGRLLRARISDRRVLALIDAWLTAGVLADGELLHPTAGTPQGGVISPCLANVYLHALDRAWQERHWRLGKLTRYADDLVIACWQPWQAQRARRALARLLAELGLKLSPEKTRIVDLTVAGEGFDFLGYHFRRLPVRRDPSRFYCACWPSQRAMAADPGPDPNGARWSPRDHGRAGDQPLPEGLGRLLPTRQLHPAVQRPRPLRLRTGRSLPLPKARQARTRNGGLPADEVRHEARHPLPGRNRPLRLRRACRSVNDAR
jgi:RNA-directed DNA polymerase